MEGLIGNKRDVRLGQTSGLPWTKGVFALDKQFVGEYNGYFFLHLRMRNSKIHGYASHRNIHTSAPGS